MANSFPDSPFHPVLKLSHGVLAILLAGSLLWAYLLAHPPGGTAPAGKSKVTLWEVPLADISSLEYREGNSRVTLSLDWSGGGEHPYLWLETSVPLPGPGPGKKPDSEKKGGNQSIAKAAFKGNAQARASLDFFAAATVLRTIGDLKSLEATEFGLPAPEAYLELKRAGERPPLRLELGRSTFGNGNRYDHSSLDGRVYLMRQIELRKLARARTSMMDRDLFPFRPTRATEMLLAMGAGRKSFVRAKPGDPWREDGEDAEDGAENERVPAFLISLERMKVLDYQPGGEGRHLDERQVLLEVRLRPEGNGGEEAWLKIFQSEGAKMTSLSSHGKKPASLSRPLMLKLLDTARKLLQES